jgi:UDP-N-acetylglucosamine--N-acetylmuramyl-(pentapeptide) pyrophosphoryl-undecaprenol N-acetylglucosamine transferase
MVLPEEELTPDRLVQDVLSLYENRSAYLTAMEQSPDRDAVDQIVSLIEKNALSK